MFKPDICFFPNSIFLPFISSLEKPIYSFAVLTLTYLNTVFSHAEKTASLTSRGVISLFVLSGSNCKTSVNDVKKLLISSIEQILVKF